MVPDFFCVFAVPLLVPESSYLKQPSLLLGTAVSYDIIGSLACLGFITHPPGTKCLYSNHTKPRGRGTPISHLCCRIL